MKKVGVIGAGSFGTAIANVLAENNTVLIYARRDEIMDAINTKKHHKGQDINPRVIATTSLQEICENCEVIFPLVPSSKFKVMLQDLSPYLKPYHIMIHGTKGFHIEKELTPETKLNKEEILTMSELILKETGVVKVGCMAGPNLATEIAQGQVAATVIASDYEEVIKVGKNLLSSSRFRVYGSNNLLGIELAGVLKNYVAIASGMSGGLGFGDNSKALLITRGMAEMIHIAKALNIDSKAFLGIAGIGDLMATCNSKLSRNYRVGYYLSQGDNLEDIISKIGEVAEGVKTLKIIKAMDHYGFKAPIAKVMYRIVFENKNIQEGIEALMSTPANNDVDYV